LKTLKFILPFIVMLAFCVNIKAQETSEEIKKKIMEAYDFFNSRDVIKEKSMKFIDESYVDHTPDPGQIPGIDGFVQSFANLKKAFPDYKITVNDMFFSKEDNKAAILITITGTNTGEMMGMPATGKKVEFTGMDYLVFKNEKCTDRWGYFDMMSLMNQLGMK
jgi:steroid delta-isomerase-like uncharacterized protein